ncbi:MAG: Ig-like domain-containing protein [Phycisphaeraceae bacterium]
MTTIFAPGAPITGANQSGGTVTMHGTSQAAPHIAGIAALAQQMADQYLGRRLTPQEFADLLRSSADMIYDGDDEDDNVTNTQLQWPRVNVHALGQAILDLAPQAGRYLVDLEVDEAVDGADFGDTLITTPAAGAVDLDPGADSGVSDSDDLTSRNNATADAVLSVIVADTLAGSTVRLYAGNGVDSPILIGQVNATGATTTIITDGTTQLADGSYTLYVTQSYPAFLPGESVASPGLSLTIDATPPALTVNSLLTDDSTPAITGTVDDASLSVSVSVTVTVNGLAYAASIAPDGTWTIADDTVAALPVGVHSVIATATDLAGNTGVDATTDELQIIAATSSISGTVWADLNADGVRDANEPGMAGVTVYLDDNNNRQLDWVDGNGNGVWDAGEGERWMTSAIDDAGTPAVNEAGAYTFAALASGDYIVRQIAPPGFAQTWPVSGGELFIETFPTTTFDTLNHWALVSDATIDGVANNEPSPPYAARFNGSPSGGDLLQSLLIDLSHFSSATLTYAWQQRGGGEEPDPGEDLVLEYSVSPGLWIELDRQLGSTASNAAAFATQVIALPAQALAASFSFRFRNTASTGNFDDWFVDDIVLSTPGTGGHQVTVGAGAAATGADLGSAHLTDAPDLDAASDSGVSSSDNITNHNAQPLNPDSTLSFTVGNLHAGDQVTLYASNTGTPGSDPVLIGQATAAVDSVTIVNNGLTHLGTVRINQQQAPASLVDQGFAFGDLGMTWAITSSTLLVELWDDVGANLYVDADAIRIERIADLSGDPVASTVRFVDDRDTGFSTVGSWGFTIEPGRYYGNDHSFATNGGGANIATYAFTGLEPGIYRISATWPFAVYDGWAFLPDGVYDIMAVVADPYGTWPPSDPLVLTVDTTPPVISVNSLSTSDTTPPITGTANEILGAVQVTVNGQNYSATVNGSTWSMADNVVAALPPGVHDVIVNGTDLAGNAASDATTNELTIVSRTPSMPDLQLGSDTGSSASDNITRLNNNSPGATLSFSIGNTTAGARVEVLTTGAPGSDPVLLGWAIAAGTTTTVVTDGTTTLAEGVRPIYARQVLGGMTSANSSSLNVTVDTVAPAVMVNTTTTSDTTPSLSGSGSESLGTVQVAVNGKVYTGSVSGTSWSLSGSLVTPALPIGVYDVAVSVTDKAGNAAGDTSADELTVVPLTPSTPDLDFGSDTGSSTTDNRTKLNNGSPAVVLTFAVGSTTVGARVEVLTTGGILLGQATAAGSSTTVITAGDWTLADGVHPVYARQIVNGLASANSAALNLTLDATPPVAGVNARVTDDSTPALSGTINESVSSVQVTINGANYAATISGLTWSIGNNVIAALPVGVYDVAVAATDTAGNLGGDTVADVLEVLAPSSAIVGTVWSDSNGDGVFDAGEPALPGVIVYLDANGNAQIDWTDGNANGVWDPGEGEPWVTSAANDTGTPEIDEAGTYVFTNLASGEYIVRQVVPIGFAQTWPIGGGGPTGGSVTVAVFDDALYVDSAGDYSSESDTVQATLASLGFTVSTFTGINAADFTSALSTADVLLVPELEKRDLAADLSAQAKAVIASFVASGGGLIVNSQLNGWSTNLLNSLLGTSLFISSSSASTRTAAAAGTEYQDDPATLDAPSATYGVLLSSLPTEAVTIYSDSFDATVLLLPYGRGKASHLAWDWYDAVPLGSRSGAWLQVLESTVLETAGNGGSHRVTLGVDDTVTNADFGNFPIPEFTVTSTTIPDGGYINASATTLTVNFSNPLPSASVQASDLTVNGVPATAITLISGTGGYIGVRFTLPAAASVPEGPATLAIAVGAITDIYGQANPALALNVTVDRIGPRVVESALQSGDVLPTGSFVYTARFSEQINVSVLNSLDIGLSGTFSTIRPSTITFDDQTFTVTATFVGAPEGWAAITLTSSISAFGDLAGNALDGEATWPLPPEGSGNGVPGGSFTVPVNIDDPAVRDLGDSFHRLLPFGSLIVATNSIDGYLHGPADVDEFHLALLGQQPLAIVVDPVYRGAIVTFTSEAGTFASPGDGDPLVVYLKDGLAAGELLFALSSDSATNYSICIYANAMVEGADTSEAAPLAIDDSLLEIGGGKRWAVVGFGENSTSYEYDAYTLNLAGLAGHLLDLTLTGLDAFSLELLGPDGTTLATSTKQPLGVVAENYHHGILGFTVPTDGTYSLRVTASTTQQYALVVAESLNVESEPNDVTTDPLRLLTSDTPVLGYIDTNRNRLFALGGAKSWPGGYFPTYLIEVDPQTGALINAAPFTGANPYQSSSSGLAFDGRWVWGATNPLQAAILHQIDPDTGISVRSFNLATLGIPGGSQIRATVPTTVMC